MEHLARNAEAALQRVVGDEGLLHRMQFAVLFKPFDGDDLTSLDRADGDQAGTHGHPVEQHRATAAVAFTATILWTGQPQIRPEHPQQQTIAVGL